LYICK
jgi:hypothetical protein